MELTQQALMTKISEYQFICVELQLYLDTHPDDEDARADMFTYSQKLAFLIDKYESIYGPLFNFGLSPTKTGCWVKSKWPWEL